MKEERANAKEKKWILKYGWNTNNLLCQIELTVLATDKDDAWRKGSELLKNSVKAKIFKEGWWNDCYEEK